MRKLEKIKNLENLLKKPVFTSKEARSAGVHPSVLSYYVKKGILERIDRGVYRARDTDIDIDFMWEDLILAVKSVSSGVVCLISALVLYEMTDEIPRVHWIAIPHSSRAPKREGIKIVRMRNLELGRTTLDIGNQSISIFDRERTIIDAFRYLGQETAIKALKTGLQAKGKNKIQLKKLQLYAKELRLNIGPYLLAVTT